MASADSNFDEYSIRIIKMLTHSLVVNYRDLPAIRSLAFTNNEREIFNTARAGLVPYSNFSFIVSEPVQVNPAQSLAECVNP